jgi:hypothetical protein
MCALQRALRPAAAAASSPRRAWTYDPDRCSPFQTLACTDLCYLQCGVEIPRLLEYLYVAAIPAATIIVALIGALYYYLRKDVRYVLLLVWSHLSQQRLTKELYSRIRDEDT